jgi:hypothetical protein
MLEWWRESSARGDVTRSFTHTATRTALSLSLTNENTTSGCFSAGVQTPVPVRLKRKWKITTPKSQQTVCFVYVFFLGIDSLLSN